MRKVWEGFIMMTEIAATIGRLRAYTKEKFSVTNPILKMELDPKIFDLLMWEYEETVATSKKPTTIKMMGCEIVRGKE